MIAWDEKFATGLESIDKQHQLLIDQINRLEELLANPKPTPAEIMFAGSLIQFLESYANTHFQFEENCMERFRCPSHAQNKDAHAEFMKFLAGFKQMFKTQGFDLEAFRDLHQTITTWITSHILRIDTQLKACVKH